MEFIRWCTFTNGYTYTCRDIVCYYSILKALNTLLFFYFTRWLCVSVKWQSSIFPSYVFCSSGFHRNSHVYHGVQFNGVDWYQCFWESSISSSEISAAVTLFPICYRWTDGEKKVSNHLKWQNKYIMMTLFSPFYFFLPSFLFEIISSCVNVTLTKSIACIPFSFIRFVFNVQWRLLNEWIRRYPTHSNRE